MSIFFGAVFISFFQFLSGVLIYDHYYLRHENKYIKSFKESKSFHDTYTVLPKNGKYVTANDMKFEVIEKLCLYPNSSRNLFLLKGFQSKDCIAVGYIFRGFTKSICVENIKDSRVKIDGNDYYLAEENKCTNESKKYQVLSLTSEQYDENISWVYVLQGSEVKRINILFIKHIQLFDLEKLNFTCTENERALLDCKNIHIMLGESAQERTQSGLNRGIKKLITKYHTDKIVGVNMTESEILKYKTILTNLTNLLIMIKNDENPDSNEEFKSYDHGYYINTTELDPRKAFIYFFNPSYISPLSHARYNYYEEQYDFPKTKCSKDTEYNMNNPYKQYNSFELNDKSNNPAKIKNLIRDVNWILAVSICILCVIFIVLIVIIFLMKL